MSIEAATCRFVRKGQQSGNGEDWHYQVTAPGTANGWSSGWKIILWTEGLSEAGAAVGTEPVGFTASSSWTARIEVRAFVPAGVSSGLTAITVNARLYDATDRSRADASKSVPCS